MLPCASAQLSNPGADLNSAGPRARQLRLARTRKEYPHVIDLPHRRAWRDGFPSRAGKRGATCAGAQQTVTCVDIVQLGAVSAMTYYTEEEDGFHVVTTIQADGRDAPVPVRLVTILQPSQKAIVSVPAELGGKASALELVRDGGRLVAHHPNARHPTELRAAAPVPH
jgi:hypothetical protein